MLNPTTLKADALGEVLESKYREVFGPEEPTYAAKLGLAARLVLEIIANSDALYHNVEHTMRVTLVGQEILKGKQTYVLRIDLFAAPEELEISKEELEKDRRAEFERIMEQLEAMDAEAVQEETDKVFERHIYWLCPICRARFHGLLRDVRTGRSRKKPPSGK